MALRAAADSEILPAVLGEGEPSGSGCRGRRRAQTELETLCAQARYVDGRLVAEVAEALLDLAVGGAGLGRGGSGRRCARTRAKARRSTAATTAGAPSSTAYSPETISLPGALTTTCE